MPGGFRREISHLRRWLSSGASAVRAIGSQYSETMKSFEQLTEREILALAISLEEEDERIYGDFAEGVRQDYPAPRRCSMACAKRSPAIGAG